MENIEEVDPEHRRARVYWLFRLLQIEESSWAVRGQWASRRDLENSAEADHTALKCDMD